MLLTDVGPVSVLTGFLNTALLAAQDLVDVVRYLRGCPIGLLDIRGSLTQRRLGVSAGYGWRGQNYGSIDCRFEYLDSRGE